MAMYKFEIYKDPKSEWRWRMTAKNGKIVGASSEAFKTKAGAARNLVLVAGYSIAYFDKESPTSYVFEVEL